MIKFIKNIITEINFKYDFIKGKFVKNHEKWLKSMFKKYPDKLKNEIKYLNEKSANNNK